MGLPRYNGPYEVGLSTMVLPIHPARKLGNCRAHGMDVLKMEEVAFNVFYPAVVADRRLKGVHWLARYACVHLLSENLLTSDNAIGLLLRWLLDTPRFQVCNSLWLTRLRVNLSSQDFPDGFSVRGGTTKSGVKDS